MIVRIFLPDALCSLKSADSPNCYLIFGKIECNDSGNVSIFIVDTKEINDFAIVNSGQHQQAIGCISPENEAHKMALPDGDFVRFTSNDSNSSHCSSSKTSILRLKNLHLPNFISVGQSFQTQMFLYNLQTFTDLAQRIDGTAWNQRRDAIAQLLVLIKNSERQKLMSSKMGSSECSLTDDCHNRLISFLLTVSQFIQWKFSFLNSSFVRHFHFWTANLEKLTQNR